MMQRGFEVSIQGSLEPWIFIEERFRRNLSKTIEVV